jgi:hypothetical protein
VSASTPTTGCPDCGHEHAGAELAGICVGCPCPRREPGLAPRLTLDLLAWFALDGDTWLVVDRGLALRAPPTWPTPPETLSQLEPAYVAPSVAPLVDGARGERRVREAGPAHGGGEVVRLGCADLQRRYVDLVEACWPEAEWYATDDPHAPVRAIADEGRVVAVVMPLRRAGRN